MQLGVLLFLQLPLNSTCLCINVDSKELTSDSPPINDISCQLKLRVSCNTEVCKSFAKLTVTASEDEYSKQNGAGAQVESKRNLEIILL
jgi:hypothetical protein